MHKRRSIGILIILMLIFTAIASNITPVFAQAASSAEFTVKAVIPDNQINTDISYFDLRMEPGQEQTLEVEVSNRSNREMTIDVYLHAASTNRNGIIEYQVAVEPDETLEHPFDTLSDTPSEITLEPNSVHTAEIKIQMPENSFSGTILGGIVFTGREESGEESGMSIKNRFSYVIGVKLTESDDVIAPDFRLKGIEPSLLNYRKAVMVSIHNPVPLIVKNADISAHVYSKNNEELLLTVNKDNIDMAPNSVYPFPIEWQGEQMEAGEYTLKLKLTLLDKVWEWEEDFTITGEQANDMNDSSLEVEKTTKSWLSMWWWVVVMSVVILLLLLWIAFLLGRRSKDKPNEKEDFRY